MNYVIGWDINSFFKENRVEVRMVQLITTLSLGSDCVDLALETTSRGRMTHEEKGREGEEGEKQGAFDNIMFF